MYKNPESRVFTGREFGKKVRELSRIDQIISENEEVTITIPPNIASINPSFLEEFLFNVVKKLGKDAFGKKVKFINEGAYKIAVDVEDAIENILKSY